MNKLLNKLLNKFGYYRTIDVYYLDKQRGMRIWSSLIVLGKSNKITIENNKARTYTIKDELKQDEEYKIMYPNLC